MKKYLIIVFSLLLISCFTEPKKVNLSLEEDKSTESLNDVNNKHETETRIVEENLPKFIYAKLKISKPVLYGRKYNSMLDLASYCDIMYEDAEYITDITEVAFYDEDIKYKLLDKVEKTIENNSTVLQQNLYGNAVVDYGYEAAEHLKNEKYKIKINTKEVLVFDSYAEASKSRK